MHFSKRKPKQNCGDIYATILVGADRRSFEYADPSNSEGNAQKIKKTKYINGLDKG
ncbi:MAG: hypothetical protein P1P64_09965 [Treponemataceae bacterium]